MPKLKMKSSSLSTEEAVHAATQRAFKNRRRHDTQHRLRSESLTPPRNRSAGASTSKHTLEHDDDFDESSLPPSQAYKRSRSYDEDEENARFIDSLNDAAAQDQGVAYYEQLLFDREMNQRAASFHYGSSVRAAMGQPGATKLMDEDEYAEYIRAGMWRRNNQEEILRLERIEKERKEKAERQRLEKERFDRLEKERIKKLQERTRKKDKQLEKDQREAYQLKWSRITSSSSSSTDTPIRFTDVPWPLFPPVPFPPLSWPQPSDIDPEAIRSFLLSHLDPDARKPALRTAVLAYHPDRFDRLTARMEDETTRERTRELGLRVSQVLNEMLKK